MHIKDSLENGDIVPAGEGEGNIPYIIEYDVVKTIQTEPDYYEEITHDS